MYVKIATVLMLFFVHRAGLASLDQTVATLMREYQIPGAAIYALDHGKASTYLFGVANKINNHPVTEQTIFEIGSLTKIFTALLLAVTSSNPDQTDDRLVKYYPKLSKNDYLKNLTFADLLTFTAGMVFELPKDINSSNKWHKYLMQWQPAYPVGTKWQYSNPAIGLAGEALEYKFNASIGDLYVTYILQPLKMKPLYQYYLAKGYQENGEQADYNPALLEGTTGMRANIKDMSYILNLAANLSGQPKKLQEAMHVTQIPRFNVGDWQQGLVWQIHALKNKNLLNTPKDAAIGPLEAKPVPKAQQIYNPNQLIDKAGATSGFRSYIVVIPATKTGLVILLNKYIPTGALVNCGRKILLEDLKGEAKI